MGCLIERDVLSHFKQEQNQLGVSLESVQSEGAVISQINPVLNRFLAKTAYIDGGTRLAPWPFRQEAYLLAAHATHYLWRLTAQYQEQPFVPITGEALEDYLLQIESASGWAGGKSFIPYWMATEIRKASPEIIEVIFPIFNKPVSGIMGISDVLLPTAIALERSPQAS